MITLFRGVFPRVALAIFLGLTVAGGGLMMWTSADEGDDPSATAVLQQGMSRAGEAWELRYRETPNGICVALAIKDTEPISACGFDIPTTTEIGFGAGLKPGIGSFFLFGLTSARVATIQAQSEGPVVEVQTSEVPLANVNPPGLRYFVVEREPIDDVDALVGFDANGVLVQRVEFPRGD